MPPKLFASPPVTWTPLLAGVVERLALVLAVIALLWMAFFWATA
ncbi:MAG: hypothetical protein ACFCBW_09575 [Candidatus Competibacterales bacterium]